MKVKINEICHNIIFSDNVLKKYYSYKIVNFTLSKTTENQILIFDNNKKHVLLNIYNKKLTDKIDIYFKDISLTFFLLFFSYNVYQNIILTKSIKYFLINSSGLYLFQYIVKKVHFYFYTEYKFKNKKEVLDCFKNNKNNQTEHLTPFFNNFFDE